jgi:cell division protein FtsL
MRENLNRKTDDRQQQNILHRQRMTCSESLRNISQTQDWTGSMGMSPSGRFQVVEEARPAKKVFSREGVRWDAAWILIAAAAVLCAGILLADLAGVGIGSRNISKLDMRIEEYMRKNDQMKQELADQSRDMSVCTEAVKLNLISGNAAQTVRLTAPAELSESAVTTEKRSSKLTGNVGD